MLHGWSGPAAAASMSCQSSVPSGIYSSVPGLDWLDFSLLTTAATLNWLRILVPERTWEGRTMV